jgi:uncharacterized protein (TIGR03382 family)
VAQNALLGQVGHSGSNTWPHLHYEAQRIDQSFQTTPLGVANAKVGLNPTASDPWRRDVPSWGIREGFFVLPEPGVPGALAFGCALVALLARRRA